MSSLRAVSCYCSPDNSTAGINTVYTYIFRFNKMRRAILNQFTSALSFL